MCIRDRHIPFEPLAEQGYPFIKEIILMGDTRYLDVYKRQEGGFGADLGAEKFLDIKCRYGGLTPNCVVVVATMRALKHHGGVKKEDLNTPNVEALAKGIVNLEKQIENMQKYNIPVVVAINKFLTDSDEEIE